MQHLEVSGAVRPLYGSLGAKGLTKHHTLDVWGSGVYLHLFSVLYTD